MGKAERIVFYINLNDSMLLLCAGSSWSRGKARYDLVFQQLIPKRGDLTQKFHKPHIWIIDCITACVAAKTDVFKRRNFHKTDRQTGKNDRR